MAFDTVSKGGEVGSLPSVQSTSAVADANIEPTSAKTTFQAERAMKKDGIEIPSHRASSVQSIA